MHDAPRIVLMRVLGFSVHEAIAARRARTSRAMRVTDAARRGDRSGTSVAWDASLIAAIERTPPKTRSRITNGIVPGPISADAATALHRFGGLDRLWGIHFDERQEPGDVHKRFDRCDPPQPFFAEFVHLPVTAVWRAVESTRASRVSAALTFAPGVSLGRAWIHSV